MPYGKGTYGSKKGRPVMSGNNKTGMAGGDGVPSKPTYTKPPKATTTQKTPAARKPVATAKTKPPRATTTQKTPAARKPVATSRSTPVFPSNVIKPPKATVTQKTPAARKPVAAKKAPARKTAARRK